MQNSYGDSLLGVHLMAPALSSSGSATANNGQPLCLSCCIVPFQPIADCPILDSHYEVPPGLKLFKLGSGYLDIFLKRFRDIPRAFILCQPTILSRQTYRCPLTPESARCPLFILTGVDFAIAPKSATETMLPRTADEKGMLEVLNRIAS